MFTTLRLPVELCSFVASVFLLASCAGPTFAPGVAPESVVIRDRTPLYRYGPQQGGAPESQLSRNDRVLVLRRELGYSLVQIADGQTGYVANEDLAPVPLLPKPSATPVIEPMDIDYSPSLPPVEPILPNLDLIPGDAPIETQG